MPLVVKTSVGNHSTHDEKKFKCAPGQRDVLGVVLSHHIEDVTVVHELLGKAGQPESCFGYGFAGRCRRIGGRGSRRGGCY